MEKVRSWCDQPSDRGRPKNRMERNCLSVRVFLWRRISEVTERRVHASRERCPPSAVVGTVLSKQLNPGSDILSVRPSVSPVER